jgi:hypothetical protein
MDGTASLANRDFGRVLRKNRRKVLFSGAAHHANEAAGAGYFAELGGESIETGLAGGAGWIRTAGTDFVNSQTTASGYGNKKIRGSG